MTSVEATGLTAVLRPRHGEDRRAPGATVTVALCGHWEHEGRCRWPHNSKVAGTDESWTLRTVVVTPADERTHVLDLVDAALRADERWLVVDISTGPVTDEERPLAARLSGVDE